MPTTPAMLGPEPATTARGLTLPAWRALAWMTQTAAREAWRLHAYQQHTMLAEDDETL